MKQFFENKMCNNNLLSPLHIHKLNHEIEEIRCRALNSVYTKYQLHLIDENNQENISQLFLKLIKWFDYDNRILDEKAMNILTNISCQSIFKSIVHDLGVEKVLTDLNSIGRKIDKQLWKELSDVKDKVLDAKRNIDESFISSIVIENLDGICENKSSETMKNYGNILEKNYRIDPADPLFFPWVQLSTSDNQILVSSFQGLRDLDDVQTIVQACHFLKDIIMEDFPIEIFLQRPRIINSFFGLLKTNTEQTHPYALNVLLNMANKIRTRINAFKDPCMRGAYINPKIAVKPEECSLKHHQLSVQEFCHHTLQCVWDISEKFKDNNHLINYIYMITSRISDISNLINDYETFKEFPVDNLNKINRWITVEELIILTIRLKCSKNIYQNKLNLENYIGDPGLLLFNGNLHCQILNNILFVQDREYIDIIDNFREGILICQSMDSAIKLSKNKSLSNETYLEYLEEALPSLEFHLNIEIIKDFFNMCINSCDVNQNLKILLKLICHSNISIQMVALEELYSYILQFSAGINKTESIIFHNALWKELVLHGGIHKNSEVQSLCKDILTSLIKFVLNLNDLNSTNLLTCVQSNLALLSAYADSSTVLGRSIVRLLEPSHVQASLLPFDQLLVGNLQLLFSKEIIVNEEAFSRLCWLLTKDDPFEKKLPKVRDIKGLHLSSVCANVKPYSKINRSFSSTRALNDCLATLNDNQSDIVNKGAALNELATIIQDDSLHTQFLLQDGLPLMLSLLDSALIEENVKCLPSFVIPVIGVLNNIVLVQSSIRKELCMKPEFICNIFRSLLLFTADEYLRQNSVQLLFFLLYNNYILEVEGYNKEFSISYLLKLKIHVPIVVREHDLHSLHAVSSSKVRIMGNKNISRLLRVYWAAHWIGDISALLLLNVEDLEKDIFSPGLPDEMKLTSSDLKSLQNIALRHNLIKKLRAIQNADSHFSVLQNIHKLTGFLLWIESYRKLEVSETLPNIRLINKVLDIDNIPWEESFNRFFITTPSCTDDEILLGHVIDFLKLLIRVIDDPDVLVWLSKLLTNPNGVTSVLIREMGNTSHSIQGRNLRYGLIELSQEVILRTAPHFDSSPWINLLKIVLSYLEANYADHLDKLFGILADITGAWSWNYNDVIELYQKIVTRVTEVIIWYTSLNDVDGSFMGSNMINNALIVLGNMMTDGSNRIKGWEQIWRVALSKAAGVETLQEANYNWLLALINNRDPITRAAALAFLASFFTSTSSFQLLFDSLNFEMSQIWMLGLNIALDSSECSLVREKATSLLERLTGLGSRDDCTDFLNYIRSEGIYSRIGEVILSLDTRKLVEKNNVSFEEPITTMNLVGCLCNWLYVVCKLKEAVVTEQIVENGLFEIILTKYSDVVSVTSIHSEELHELSFATIRFARLCIQASLKARAAICANILHVKSFCAVLEKYEKDSNLPNSEVELEEAICLISTLLETEEGVLVFKNALHTCRSVIFFENIVAALQSHHQLFALSLVNNLATQQLAHFFIQETPSGPFGRVLCEKLLTMDLKFSHKPLTNLFITYKPAQEYAIEKGFTKRILQRLRKITDSLNKFGLDDLRKPSRKKQIEPLLNNIEDFYQMLTNFCYQNVSAKSRLAESGLSEAVYKLWPWYGVRPNLIQILLKLLHTFTYKCEKACQSLALTSTLPGTGNVTLIHSIAHLAVVEMNLLSKIKDSTNLSLALNLLSNSCEAIECRCVLARGGILTPLAKLLPSSHHKKLFNDNILKIWLNFLNVFTAFSEGQYSVSRDPAALEFILWMAGGSNRDAQVLSFSVLVHLAINPQNRCQLLSTPAPLLNLLMSAFRSEDETLIKFAAAIVWSLAANSHKSKVILRSAGCENAIIEASKTCIMPDCLQTLEQTLKVLNNK